MLNRLITYCRILSLDVVLGACVSSMFMARYIGVSLPMSVLVALGLAVWMIYTFDHLRDAVLPNAPQTKRHDFHARYHKELKRGLGIAILNGGYVVYVLPEGVRDAGIIAALVVGAYFLGLKLFGRSPSAYKEICVAILYSVGVFLGPATLSQNAIGNDLILLFMMYVGMALINLILFSRYELEADKQAQQSSIVRLMGVNGANKLLSVLITLLFTVWGIFTFYLTSFGMTSLVLLLMNVSLFALAVFPKLFQASERYRLLGDAIFYFPIIALI